LNTLKVNSFSNHEKDHASASIGASVIINNDIYNQLGERWYTAKDDPVALLRAESKCRNPWVIETIQKHLNVQNNLNGLSDPNHLNHQETNTRVEKAKILDVGCGGGFLSNPLAQAGHQVTGVDVSTESLEVAKRYDTTQSVHYLNADAYQLPFADHEFDIVCAMDFLEHVEDPGKAIQEMGRVLKPGGLFFFHTFNRNPISAFVVIRLVEWLVKNTPPHMHISRLFIKPKELTEYCRRSKMEVVEMRGLQPVIFSLAVLRGLFTGVVEDGFRFKFGKSLITSYCGFSKKTV
jgi:2-polyprenyl-6-hydroxyphenyl methylase/3-demethylubiquinone-9 3-methyltransferase